MQHFIHHPFSFFESREVFETFPLSLAKSSVRMRRHFPSALCLLYCFVLRPPFVEWHFCREAPPRVSSVWPCGLPRTWAAAAPATSGRPGQGRVPPSHLQLLFLGVTCRPPRQPPWASTARLASLPGWGRGGWPWSARPPAWGGALPPQNLALPREEPLVFREAASCPGPSRFWAGAPLFPQLGSGVTVFGRQSLGYGCCLVFLSMDFSSHFILLLPSVWIGGERHKCAFHLPSFSGSLLQSLSLASVSEIASARCSHLALLHHVLCSWSRGPRRTQEEKEAFVQHRFIWNS